MLIEQLRAALANGLNGFDCPCLVPASCRIVESEEVAQSRSELPIHSTAQMLSALNPLQVEVISLIRANISSSSVDIINSFELLDEKRIGPQDGD